MYYKNNKYMKDSSLGLLKVCIFYFCFCCYGNFKEDRRWIVKYYSKNFFYKKSRVFFKFRIFIFVVNWWI